MDAQQVGSHSGARGADYVLGDVFGAGVDEECHAWSRLLLLIHTRQLQLVL